MSRRIPYTSFVPIVIALNCVFTVFVAMLESGICDYSSYPNETWAALDNYDMQTAFYREESDLPFRLAVLECLIGLCHAHHTGICDGNGGFDPRNHYYNIGCRQSTFHGRIGML